MPELSRFLGIVVFIAYGDHPPPHFHARYGEYKVTIDIESGVVQGRFPRRAMKALLDWYEIHRDELMQAWLLAEQHLPPNPIDPLE